MTEDAARLRAMHAGPRPLILPNVWDPVSAEAYASAGFAALATSSSAIAATLGYRDGQTPADEMFAAIARIVASARSAGVPVTADVEAGYRLSPRELVNRLADCGVAGCNLEDSDSATQTLTDPGKQAGYLAAVRAEAGPDLVINARVDVYVRPPAADYARAAVTAAPRAGAAGASADAARADPALADAAVADSALTDAALADAVARANAYLAAGADCTYPILAPPAALPALVREIDGPVNAMFRPGGPSLAELGAIGIARITFGGGLHTQVARHVQALAGTLAAEAAEVTPAADR